MVFSTAFGTALFGVLIDSGFLLDQIMMICISYIVLSLFLLFGIRGSIKPEYITKKAWFIQLKWNIKHNMARITVEDCLEKIDNQYDLVLLAKERTTQLNSGAPMLVDEDNDKKTIIALREIADGKVQIDEIEKNAILRLRKEPDEIEQQEEVEEEESDDFENLYKGQVSKSGAAILPSKRVRRVPENKSTKSN